MMRALVLSRVRLARRAWLHRPPRGGWVRHPLAALAVAAWLGSFVLAGLRALFTALAANGANAHEMAAVLALALSAALAALVVFDVDDAVRTLVADSDLELLRRAPISPATLFTLKAIDAGPRALLPMLVLALPALIAYAGRVAAGTTYWCAAAAVLATLWVMPLSIGAALSLLLLRVAPPARARETLSLLATLTLTLLWIASAVLLPRALDAGPGTLAGLRVVMARALESPGPAAAAARALAAAASGDLATSVREIAWLTIVAVAAVLAALAVAHVALPAVLERLAGGSARSARAARRGAEARPFEWRTRGVARAIVRRDGRMLRRSWTLLGDLAVASVLWTLLPLAAASRVDLPWNPLARLMLLTVSVGLGYEIAARSVPFERHASYWSRVAPVDSSRWLAGKLAGSASLAAPVVVMVGAALVIARPLGGRDLWASACLAAGALGLSLSTGLWAGIVFGDPEWINPRAMLRLAGRLVASGLLLAELALWLGVAALIGTWPGHDSIGVWAAIPLVGSLLAMIPLYSARRHMVRQDSSH